MKYPVTLFLILIFTSLVSNAQVQVPLTFQTSQSPESTSIFNIQVQTSTDSSFSSILEESPWLSCQENSQFTYSANFPESVSTATYWWRARHDNGLVVSDWSLPYHFNLNLTPQLLVSLQPDHQVNYTGETDTLWIDLSDSVTNLVGAYFKLSYEDSFILPLQVISGPVLTPPENFFLSYDIYPDSVLISLASLGESFSNLGPILGVILRAESQTDSTSISFERSTLRDSLNRNIPHLRHGAWIQIQALDTIPPPAPSNFAARPGNNRCKLSWTNPNDDPSFAGVEIRRYPWRDSAYPEYDDLFPTPLGYPANQAEGTLIYKGTAQSFVDSTATTRNVYYYSVFSYDSSDNYSSGDTAKATNYRLGDVSGDGLVYFEDLVIFAESYGTLDGDSNYFAEFDIGPTYDMSPLGIPTTDDAIDFEDLVIFALNYMTAGDGKPIPRALAKETSGNPGLSLSLPVERLKVGKEFEVKISLNNNPDTVKSIHFVLPYDSLELEFVNLRRSYELIDSSYAVFFYGKDTEHKIDVSLAILGGNTPIIGSGEIAVITFKLLKNIKPTLAFSLVDLRDGDGNTLDIKEDNEYTETPAMPEAYSISQNYPNPFNPYTTISFNLKAQSTNYDKPVRTTLNIYNIKGQLVKTLLDEEKSPGNYSIIWEGKDNYGREVASGIYFYKLKTSDYAETKKMILVR